MDLAEIWPHFLPGKGHPSPNSGLDLLSGFGGKVENKRKKYIKNRQMKNLKPPTTMYKRPNNLELSAVAVW